MRISRCDTQLHHYCCRRCRPPAPWNRDSVFDTERRKKDLVGQTGASGVARTRLRDWFSSRIEFPISERHLTDVVVKPNKLRPQWAA
jgi:hypothetical protein